MPFTFGFYDSMGGDRKYNAKQMSAIFDGLITDGVFHSQGEIFGVIPGVGMQSIVKTGRAWFNHTWNLNDTLMPVYHPPADVTLSRYDAVVLEVNSDLSVRTNRLMVVAGIPGSNPSKPSLANTSTLRQWPLAYVLIPPASSSISQANIQVVVGTSECPFVTGILESVNIDVLFNQWQGSFDSWFRNLQNSLEGDIATNLLNQINQRVKIANLATMNEAVEGIDNEKWMSPLRTKQAIDASIADIGDIKISARNLEIESNGKFVTCDGRILTTAAYPTLESRIKGIFGRPVSYSLVSAFSNENRGNAWYGFSYSTSPLGIKTVLLNVAENNTYAVRYSAQNALLGLYQIPQGEGGFVPVTIFNIDEACYVIVHSSSTSSVRVYSLSNTSATQLWSTTNIASFEVLGATRISNTVYLAIQSARTGSGTGRYSSSVLSVAGSTVVNTQVRSNTDNPTAMILLGRTLYLRNDLEQTDVVSISFQAITNSTILSIFAATPVTKFYVGTADAKILITDSVSIATRTITRLTLADNGTITQDSCNVNGTFTGRLNANIETDGRISVVNSTGTQIGAEITKGVIYLGKSTSIPFSLGSFAHKESMYKIATPQLFVLQQVTGSGTSYTLQHLICSRDMTKFFVPSETPMPDGVPYTRYLKALE